MSRHDEQLKRLTATPKDISSEWSHAIGFFAGVGNNPKFPAVANIPYICLTQMKLHLFNKEDVNILIKGEKHPELTEKLRNDNRIPRNGAGINTGNLKYFKEWWEEIDKLNNTV